MSKISLDSNSRFRDQIYFHFKRDLYVNRYDRFGSLVDLELTWIYIDSISSIDLIWAKSDQIFLGAN